MAVSVGISILGHGFLSTIPWIIIIPFVLGLLYKENMLIIATALIFNILFNIILQKPDYIIFTSIYILLCTGAGLFLADSIKNLKTNQWGENMKYIKLIIAVIVTGIAIYIYSGFFGNPIEYLKVKHAFEDYICLLYTSRCV